MTTCKTRPEVHVIGWKCVIKHDEVDEPNMPCGMTPRWWNLKWVVWYYKNVLR